MNGFLQGPRGAPGVPGPPGENGADVSWKLPSSLAVIVGSSSRRLGWPRLLLEQSGMTHQSDPCITVFSAGSGGGRIDGLSLLWLLPALSPSCVVSCPPAVGCAFPRPSWPLLERRGASHCGRMQAVPSCQCRCLWVWGYTCRHPWNTGLDG